MMSREIIYILIWTLVATVSAIPIPDDLFCCSLDTGTFRYFNFTETGCWDDKTNKTNPVRLACPSTYVFSQELFNFTINEYGQVFLTESNMEIVELKREELCFANDTDPTTDEVLNLIVACAVDETKDIIIGYCILVSAVFLLLTTVVYLVLPEIRDLSGKSIINFCGSMGIGLAILSGVKLLPYEDMALCATRGFMVYFFLIASFFWSNAISVQVLLSLRRPVVNNYSWKEFSWYALYAWGCSTVLTLCMAIVNFHPGDHKKPGIGLNTCWFYDNRQQWYYMYSVMSILIITNICIYIYTSVQLWRLSFSSSHVKALRYRFVMMLRMFVIMGVTWIFEMLSSLTEKNIIWFIIDVFNTLYGPLTFLVLVVLRKRVVKALLKRGYLTCVAEPVERCLARNEDDEEGVIQHTIDATMTESNGI